ncbi:uncharacterized protein [Dysidea avara]|uniref:uncharacterized protein isoform X2 n=1 Tax=Dysidea avara TaxID=196820 RepID=UPI003320F220
MEDHKTVVVVYGERRRPVRFKPGSTPKEEVNTATSKAKGVCKKLGKPSAANAKVLAGLFPAYSTSGVKRKFNPNVECVAAEQQRKKKAAVKGKGRGKTVQAVLIEDPSTIPKRAKKELLQKDGKAKWIEFHRHFSADDVSRLLAETFSDMGKARFIFLQPHKNNQLTTIKEQNLDGNAIFQLAKNGTLYLQCIRDKSSEKPPVDLVQQGYNQEKAVALQQEATAIVKKLRAACKPGSLGNPLCVSDSDGHIGQMDDSGEGKVAESAEAAQRFEDLQEWRQVRAQDIEYNEALEQDMAKEAAKEREEEKMKLYEQI